ncbi:hypothetical protein [Herminiimonas aquatilis]|uniref:Uncharacterized protein n=1 Tax=Herminiimonas aquatilis TaxID=345342 RepID=A0ABW2J930_9BURK
MIELVNDGVFFLELISLMKTKNQLVPVHLGWDHLASNLHMPPMQVLLAALDQ